MNFHASHEFPCFFSYCILHLALQNSVEMKCISIFNFFKTVFLEKNTVFPTFARRDSGRKITEFYIGSCNNI